LEARKLLAENEELSPRADLEDDEFLFDIDCDVAGSEIGMKMTMDSPLMRAPFQPGHGIGYGRNPFSKLYESIEEEGEEEEGDGKYPEGFVTFPPHEKFPKVSEISVSLKNTMLSEASKKHMKHSGGKADNGHYGNTSSGRRSANEKLPTSISFVSMADMTEDQWTMFLEKFQELLYPAFSKRKSITIGQRQIQRLGTSCQF